MIVFHGSNQIVKNPDLSHSFKNLDFGKDDYKNYDLIIGKVANDKVFRVVDMYHSGIWDKSRAIKEIRAYQIYNQIAFVSEKSLNLISFKSSEVIK